MRALFLGFFPAGRCGTVFLDGPVSVLEDFEAAFIFLTARSLLAGYDTRKGEDLDRNTAERNLHGPADFYRKRFEPVHMKDDVEQLHDVRIERVIIGDLDDRRLTTALSAAAREALVNAAKHSGENKAHLFCEVEEKAVTLLVRDRGVGFDVDQGDKGFGLRSSIHERIESVGGAVEVRTSAGRGTAIEMTVPRVAS